MQILLRQFFEDIKQLHDECMKSVRVFSFCLVVTVNYLLNFGV